MTASINKEIHMHFHKSTVNRLAFACMLRSGPLLYESNEIEYNQVNYQEEVVMTTGRKIRPLAYTRNLLGYNVDPYESTGKDIVKFPKRDSLLDECMYSDHMAQPGEYHLIKSGFDTLSTQGSQYHGPFFAFEDNNDGSNVLDGLEADVDIKRIRLSQFFSADIGRGKVTHTKSRYCAGVLWRVPFYGWTCNPGVWIDYAIGEYNWYQGDSMDSKRAHVSLGRFKKRTAALASMKLKILPSSSQQLLAITGYLTVRWLHIVGKLMASTRQYVADFTRDLVAKDPITYDNLMDKTKHFDDDGYILNDRELVHQFTPVSIKSFKSYTCNVNLRTNGASGINKAEKKEIMISYDTPEKLLALCLSIRGYMIGMGAAFLCSLTQNSILGVRPKRGISKEFIVQPTNAARKALLGLTANQTLKSHNNTGTFNVGQQPDNTPIIVRLNGVMNESIQPPEDA